MFMTDNYWECWWDGQNHADCGHHIFGRGKEEGCEKSPFNYAPLSNHFCHLPNHGKITTDAGKAFMFKKTVDFLERIGYQLTEEDNEFLDKYGLEINRLMKHYDELVSKLETQERKETSAARS